MENDMRDDNAFSPVLGTSLCVGITVTMFAACALPILGWCWTFNCETHYEPLRHGGTWADCDLAGSDHFPACHGRDVVTDQQGHANCHPVVRYVGGGGRPGVNTEEGTVCEVVAEGKDPGDNWHEHT